ncbi:MAG: hypothetical protein Q8Q09_14345 [Deltaproteobacteria bacterium]|nr:hypothetical protein [Deltaproteobacteria bacterium]
MDAVDSRRVRVGATVFVPQDAGFFAAVSSIEQRLIGGEPVLLLVALEGELCTPALESVVSKFTKLTALDDNAANTLLSAAAPSMLTRNAAICLIHPAYVLTATAGEAHVYRERNAQLARTEGRCETTEQGHWLACTGDALTEGSEFFAPGLDVARAALGIHEGVFAMGDPNFDRDGLDAWLERCLARAAGDVARAAAAACWV